MIRLFVALPFPETVRLHLSMLNGGVPGARWIAPENYHITLRFIGGVENSVADDIDAALSTVSTPPFELSFNGVGNFGKASAARSLWAGIARTDALDHLQAKIESALTRAGLALEQRRFVPHVTLARLKRAPSGRVEQFVADHAGFRSAPIMIDRFALFSSFLSSSGAIYTPEAEYFLEDQPRAIAHGC